MHQVSKVEFVDVDIINLWARPTFRSVLAAIAMLQECMYKQEEQRISVQNR